MSEAKKNIISKFLNLGPIILLFFSVLNEFDFNYNYIFSFNFPFILIFYWSLKKTDIIGYGYAFCAGLINDVVVGLPIGISSLSYMLLCGFAAYLKNITLRPNLINDWLFFLLTILIINSLSYSILIILFGISQNYGDLFLNISITFLMYLPLAFIFSIYEKTVFQEK